MLSYKQWKSLNESVLPSFTLGVSGPHNIGLQLQNGFDLDEGKHAKKKKEGDDEPDVEVEVKEKEEKSHKKDKKCGMKCSKCEKCGKMSKKGMFSDDEDYEEEEEGEDEDHEEEEGEDEDHEEEEGEDEDHEEEEGEDEEEDEAPKMKMSKKKMLKGNQHKLDADGDGKITGADFKILRNKSKKNENAVADANQKQIDYHQEIGSDGMPDPKKPSAKNSQNFRGGNPYQHPYSKGMKKKMKRENQDWWDSISQMASNPYEKFNDGWNELFSPVDVDNLSVAVREEPGPGEVGYAPSARLGGALGGNALEEATKEKPSKGGKWSVLQTIADKEEEESEEEKREKEDKELEAEYEGGEQGQGVRWSPKKKKMKKMKNEDIEQLWTSLTNMVGEL